MKGRALLVSLCLLACPLLVRAQTLQGARVGDVSLGRFGYVDGGGGFGYRHDHSFALRTPGLRREDLYTIFTIRLPFKKKDVPLGLYTSWQNVGHMWWPKTEDSLRNNVNGSPELSAFGFWSARFGEIGLRAGYLRSLDRASSAKTWRTAVAASRTRPIDLVQLLPNSQAVRSSMHYRLDYGIAFIQADLGFDYRWPLSREKAFRQNTEGEIVHFSVCAGIGLTRWGVTYSMAQVWAARKLFDSRETDESWKTSVTPNKNRIRAAAHSLAVHFYNRHWSPYVGLTLIGKRRAATALSVGVDYIF